MNEETFLMKAVTIVIRFHRHCGRLRGYAFSLDLEKVVKPGKMFGHVPETHCMLVNIPVQLETLLSLRCFGKMASTTRGRELKLNERMHSNKDAYWRYSCVRI